MTMCMPFHDHFKYSTFLSTRSIILNRSKKFNNRSSANYKALDR